MQGSNLFNNLQPSSIFNFENRLALLKAGRTKLESYRTHVIFTVDKRGIEDTWQGTRQLHSVRWRTKVSMTNMEIISSTSTWPNLTGEH